MKNIYFCVFILLLVTISRADADFLNFSEVSVQTLESTNILNDTICEKEKVGFANEDCGSSSVKDLPQLEGLNALILEGTNVGNGGNSIVCKSQGQAEQALFYDYYESLIIGDPIELRFPHLLKADFKKMSKAFVEIFKLVDPYMAAYMDLELQFFDRNVVYFNGSQNIPVDFTDTQDLKEQVSLPPHCRLKQTIVQYNDKLSTRAKYYIDLQTFSEMDEFNKSVALIHELIYSYFINIGMYGDSRPVRRMTRFIFSLPAYLDLLTYETLLKYSRQYAEVAKDIGLNNVTLYNPILGYFPVSLEKTELRYCPMTDVVQSAYLKNYDISKLVGVANFHYTGAASFYCAGSVKRLLLQQYQVPVQLEIQGLVTNCYKFLEFKNNKVDSCI